MTEQKNLQNRIFVVRLYEKEAKNKYKSPPLQVRPSVITVI